MTMEPKKLTGRAKGGAARQASLTPEQRKENARKAALAKAELAKLPKPTHSGVLKLGNVDIPCVVLPDGRRLLSQRGVMAAIGRKYGSKDFQLAAEIGAEFGGGGNFPVYLAATSLKPFIDADLAVVVSSPVKYVDPTANSAAFGLDAALLPKVLDVWLRARDSNALSNDAQRASAAKADILMRGLAHVGIIALVDEATGYQKDRARDALARILEAYVAKELQPWVKTFDADYYEQMFRLRGLPYPPDNPNFRPQYFGKLTNDIVYRRLAPGVLSALKEENSKAEKKGKLHQHLTAGFGRQNLTKHLGKVVALMQISESWPDFMIKINKVAQRYGETIEMDLEESDQ